jgi:hypothetical protein
VVPPWTQALSIRWGPALRFYEQRIAILRDFEDQGVLKAFVVSEDRIAARLLDPGHRFSIGREGLRLSLAGMNADFESVWPFVSAAVDHLVPLRTRGMTVDMQHLIELEKPFRDAVMAAQASLCAVPPIGELSYEDFALLLDLQGPMATRGQVELGIIRADEAPTRLSRSIGRLEGGSPGETKVNWAGTEFPAVALFVDSTWSRRLRQDDSLDTILGSFNSAKTHAAEFASVLHEKIVADEVERGIVER